MKKLKNLMAGFWRLAGPGAVMMLIEAWSFELSTLLAGYLGTVALDAHLTMLQLATLSFLSLPFAVAIASTIRIGNLLGAGDGRRAADAMYVTFCICVGFMLVCGVVFAAGADYLGYVFTEDADVIKATARIAYIAALFQVPPTPYTLHPTPYTLHPTPYTLHPTPYTLLPTPYTLHPAPHNPQSTPHTPMAM